MRPVLAFIGTLLFAYLVGSFIALSFNISEWSEAGRAMIATMATGMAAIISLCVAGKL